jgi:hypothetical protein
LPGKEDPAGTRRAIVVSDHIRGLGNAMQDDKENPGNAGWWARMPGGEIRRIWVTRKGRDYVCRTEVSGATARELVTADRNEAIDFLGRDDLAESALSAADTDDDRSES